jgi:hypothetical protein
MVVKTKKNLVTIGGKDIVDFPEIGILDLPCKIDTGAASSAIHCERVKLKEVNGKEVLMVRFLDKTIPQYKRKDWIFESFSEKKIRNSFGDTEYRYTIKLKVILFGQEFESEFSLADRAVMRYQVLLGRKLLFRKFLVDVSKSNLSFKSKHLLP